MKLWTFGYKRSPAPATVGVVEAETEGQAFLVATAWVATQGTAVRGPFGTVRPLVLAGPEILGKVPVWAGAGDGLPGAVEATTGSLTERLTGVFKR